MYLSDIARNTMNIQDEHNKAMPLQIQGQFIHTKVIRHDVKTVPLRPCHSVGGHGASERVAFLLRVYFHPSRCRPMRQILKGSTYLSTFTCDELVAIFMRMLGCANSFFSNDCFPCAKKNNIYIYLYIYIYIYMYIYYWGHLCIGAHHTNWNDFKCLLQNVYLWNMKCYSYSSCRPARMRRVLLSGRYRNVISLDISPNT